MKMRESKIFSWITDFVMAYCIGNCRLFGLSPFGTALLGAGGISGRNVWMMALGLLFGVFTDKSRFGTVSTMLRYAVLWALICIGMKIRRLQLSHPRRFLLSLLSGGVTIIVNLAFAFFLPGSILLFNGVLEGVLVFSLTFAYSFSLSVLQEDVYGFLEDTQALLAVLILATSVMAGLPIRLFSEIEVAQSVCLFTIFLVWYKFGFGAGVSWAAISGAVYAIRTGDIKLLPAWVFVTMVSACLSGFFHVGRYGSAILYAVSYFIFGYFGFPGLLSEEGIKAGVTALFLILFIPSRILYQTSGRRGMQEDNGAEWGGLVVRRMQELANAFKRIDYTFAVAGDTGIGFGQVGNMLEGFTKELDDRVPMRRTTEAAILEELGKLGIQVKSITLLKSKNGIYQVYLHARVTRGRLVGADRVREIISRETGIAFILGADSRQLVGRNYDIIILEQKPVFRLITAARRLSCREEAMSGDNFYIGTALHGQALVMIADGMGSGSRAAADSEELLVSLQELLVCGFDEEMSIRLVNAYLAEKNRGEHFATLDMLLLDLHTGYGHMIKYGAATTYIRRGNWMECLKSTSLPVGVIEDAGCECSRKKYYAGDLIVMVSDGVLDSILFENKDDYMNSLLEGLESDEPEDVVELIVSEVKKVCGNRLRDDATVVACKLVKSL